MQVYLPIAGLSVDALLFFGIGGAVGFLSGMFGVGGGFLMTPLLIFSGIPPAVAVATGANQIIAASVSGALAHWRRKAIDLKMGTILLLGGSAGSFVGIWLFGIVGQVGQIDLLIVICYVVLLGVIGSLMLVESLGAMRRARRSGPADTSRRRQHGWIHRLPLRTRFRTSRLYISVIPPIVIGTVVGALAAIMGVGGGFILVPAMIYLLRMPTNVVIGTSLFQIIFVTGIVTVLHAVEHQSVDIVLTMLLVLGGGIGAMYGARAGQGLRGEQLRALLAALVLTVGARLAGDLLTRPIEVFSLTSLATGGL